MATEDFTPLSIDTYKDFGAVLAYLTKTISARHILNGIGRSYTCVVEWLAEENASSDLASTVCSMRHRESTTQPARIRNAWLYGLWSTGLVIPYSMSQSQVLLKDGSLRFTVTPKDIRSLQEIYLSYIHHFLKKYGFLSKPWLARVADIIRQLGIHMRDEWMEYSILNGPFWLSFRRKIGHTWRQLNTHKQDASPVYLFVRRIPELSDDETFWKSWVKGRKYYWSSHPSGLQKMSEAAQASSGLPTFASMIAVAHSYWRRQRQRFAVFRGLAADGGNVAIPQAYWKLENAQCQIDVTVSSSTSNISEICDDIGVGESGDIAEPGVFDSEEEERSLPDT
ncbi:hypothetical protein Moror_4849, partial [Moniliophthora roreri MCA 2997]